MSTSVFAILKNVERAGEVVEVDCRHCGRKHRVMRYFLACADIFKNCDRPDCIMSRMRGEFPYTDKQGFRPVSG